VENFYFNLSVYVQVTLWVLVIAFVFQVIFYLVVYGKVAWARLGVKKQSANQEPVSIIICAKNEAENLQMHLPKILEQDYPSFEVIVVNDCSEDNTQDILEKMQEKYPQLKITRIKEDEKFSHGKKLALTIGIKAAKNEWLLLTDADCFPESNQWLSGMQRNFTGNAEIVLGYGGYIAVKGFLNKLIRFDTFSIALQYFGFAMCKVPYMGVGRNLAYKKSLFLKNKGFAPHAQILSGDDDLFINEVASGKNTETEFCLPTHTRSIPKKTFSQWKIQKLRHFSTGNRYKLKHKLLIGVENFTRFLFYASAISLLITGGMYYVVVGVFFIRYLLHFLVYAKALKKLNEKNLLLISLLFDIILPVINLFLYVSTIFNSKQHKWK
jgi:poly-beta-1,6-N-acetyl-D-glucosamine synthase